MHLEKVLYFPVQTTAWVLNLIYPQTYMLSSVLNVVSSINLVLKLVLTFENGLLLGFDTIMLLKTIELTALVIIWRKEQKIPRICFSDMKILEVLPVPKQ